MANPWCIAPIHTSLGGVQEIGVPGTHPEGTWTPLHMRITATVTTSLTPKAIYYLIVLGGGPEL